MHVDGFLRRIHMLFGHDKPRLHFLSYTSSGYDELKGHGITCPLFRNCYQNKNTLSTLNEDSLVLPLHGEKSPQCSLGPHRSIFDTPDLFVCFLGENRDPFLKSHIIPRAAIPNQTR
ncbi:hypothetical protein BYT27DRAFT_6660563 [Phlegmacium glaucopus]|nr:hypothetical protein BYT27DRAFT_6660563 [Phlegmacium glaucopus]